MKKRMALGLLAFSVLTVAGCSDNSFSKGSGSDSVLNNTNNDSTENKTHTYNEPFLVSSIPQNIFFNNEEYIMLTGIGNSNRIKENKIGDLLGYLINSDDVDNFIIDFPNTLYVVYDGIYDVNTNNRVAFYKVIGEDDMNYICCQQLLYRKAIK